MPLLKCSAGKAKPQSAIGARQDNLTPQEAHKFAEEVAAKLFQDYECVLATHTDTNTVHSHIIVNAVDPLTGKKLQFSPKDYIAMKDEVNRLGKEHGYTETDFRKRGKNSRTAAERKIMLNGGVSWKEELREVIVEAIGKSHNEQEFKDYLKTCYGVEITRSGKDYSYLHPQKQKPIRGAKLGTNYTKNEVLRKLGEQNNRHKTTTDYGHGTSGFNRQLSGAGIVRTSRSTHRGSAGRLLYKALTVSNAKCNKLVSNQNALIEELTRQVKNVRSSVNELEWNLKEENENLLNKMRQQSESMQMNIKENVRELKDLTVQIQTEVRTATAKATDEAAKVLTKRINDMADGAIEKVNTSTAAITEKVKAAEQEIARVKDDIHFERGFRKFFFWATPILLLAQTVVSIFLLLR